MLAETNEYLSDTAETMLESSQDISIRTFCEGVEEARRLRRGLEIRLEQAEAELQAKDEEIAHLKALLAEK